MKNYFFYSIILLILSSSFSGCINNNDETKFYGNVDIRTVSLGFRVGGKIESINFDEGQNVKKGEVLAKLDDSLYKEYLNEIEAEIEGAKANLNKLQTGYRPENIEMANATLLQKEISLNKAKKDFQRNQSLLRNNSISKQQYDNIKEVYDNAKASYEYAKSNLELLKSGYEKSDIDSAIAKLKALEAQKNLKKINLDDTILYAPSNGVILTRAYETGSIVNASVPVIEMAKNDEYWIRSYMSEKFLGKIHPQMKAKIYTDSSNKTYEGEVSFISSIAEFTPKSVQTEDLRTDLVYRFRIIIKDFDKKLKQGMPVTIKFDELK